MAKLKNVKPPKADTTKKQNTKVAPKTKAPEKTNERPEQRFLDLISSGLDVLDSLSVSYNTFFLQKTEVENATSDIEIKRIQATTGVTKEANRHEEAMIKIEQEWSKINNAENARAERYAFAQKQIQKFQDEYDRYNNMDDQTFLSDAVTKRLEDLRKIIKDLSIEIMRMK